MPPAETDFTGFYVVILKRAVLLVRRPNTDWRALQAEFFDFKTSLGPWTLNAASAWIRDEYGADAERDDDIQAFAVSVETAMSV